LDLKSEIAEIAIVSIFGRGLWLAAELAKKKIPVTVLEISAQMGKWKPEDAQGPFGAFAPDDQKLLEMLGPHHCLQAPYGFTIWSQSGPLEFRGPNVKHRLLTWQVPEIVIRYLQSEEILKSSELKTSDLKSLEAFPFQKNWLMHFAHALASNVATLSTEAAREGMKRNLFSAFSVQIASPESLEHRLKWCEQQGVQVIRDVELKDLSFIEKGQIAGLEIRTTKPGMFKAEQFVLCLTSEESGMINSQVQNALFPKGALEPDWVWVRFEVSIEGRAPLAHLTRSQLPAHFVVIQDLELPWSHENLMIWQKRNQPDSFDVWIKIPNAHRFQKQYLEDRGAEICQIMRQRLPENEFKVTTLPLEANQTFQDLGPTRHPVYSRALRMLRSRFEHANVFFHSPEFWSNLAWEGELEQEQKIKERLVLWWNHKEELRIKREMKDSSRVKDDKNQGADL
jgi:hypothetical protein